MKVRRLHVKEQCAAFLKEQEFIKYLIRSNKEAEAEERQFKLLPLEKQLEYSNPNWREQLKQEFAEEIELCKKRIEKNKHKFCTKLQLKKYIKHFGMENYYPDLFTKLK